MMKKVILSFAFICCALMCAAQTDSLSRHLTLNAQSWARGEVRVGALPAENGAGYAMFLMGNTVLRLDYTTPWLDVRFAPKYFGVWGSSANGNLAIDEAWFTLKSKNGFAARFGRQKLSYDDQRIMGDDDWAMASKTHDALKASYEGGKHKVHLILAFNQNNENLSGGTYYASGGQPYKSMETLWYHFDPWPWLGTSLICMNTGMQSVLSNENKTYYQQIFGGFMDFHPNNFSLQASYYRQMGFNETALPIHSWMTSAESVWKAKANLSLMAGYFHMSGDPYYYVPPEGAFGMARKTEVSGFNPIFGSHHKFYGAMDFFYVTTYYGGNTPGLQDFHIGAKWSPVSKLALQGMYHFLATSVAIKDADKALGHELEASLSWNIAKDVNLQAGYTFMRGTETMSVLKRSGDNNRLHWGWLMMIITPEFFRL